MASTTPNYNLNKIDLTDSPPDITVLNDNFDTIDEELAAASAMTDTVTGTKFKWGVENGLVYIEEVG